ncbi:MAG: hypothetical protein NT014_04640 [Candidatus Omnitrophica bacterium]|nr:hypothetical protein [Candidatus Omnitrophota bacterium]
MQKKFKIIIYSLMLVASGIFCRQAQATFDLSYLMDEGGYRLEFDRNNFSRGITFTTLNDVPNNRYEIRQRIESPLRNRDNPAVTISDNFVVRGFRGSNKYGDLRLPTGDIAVRNDELIYVSNSTGTADSFTLVYGIINTQDLTPGYYTGRISLVLNPINSSASPVTRVIEIYVNIPNDGGSLSVSVAAAEGASSIIINPADSNDLRGAANAVVTINSSFNGPFRIMQMLPVPIQSQEGKFIDNDNLLFSIPDAQKGVAINQATPISNNIQTIYSSRPDGSADKAFTIAYSLADPLSLVAGSYRSRIQYLLESNGKQINLGALDLEIRQERIFEISVSPQDQRYSIDFMDLKPSDGPRLNEVLIEVKSNLGRPYQVTQNVLSELVNGNGDKIPVENFLVQTLAANNTRGNLKITNKVAVGKGNLLLFVSDPNGSADKFKITYELTCPPDLRAGNYSSRITYTLTEI